MATSKRTEILDWYGNPIPGVYRSKSKDRIEEDADGKKYWVPPNGDERVPLDLFYLKVEDETGTVLYDSRCDPPQLAQA